MTSNSGILQTTDTQDNEDLGETRADEDGSPIFARETNDDDSQAEFRSSKEQSLPQGQVIDQSTRDSQSEQQESGTTRDSIQWEVVEDEPGPYDASSSNRRRRTKRNHAIVRERVNLPAKSDRQVYSSKGLKHINRRLVNGRIASSSSASLSYVTLKKTIRREIQEYLREEERKVGGSRIPEEARPEIQKQEPSRHPQDKQIHVKHDNNTGTEPSMQGDSPVTSLDEDQFEEMVMKQFGRSKADLENLLRDESKKEDKEKEPKQPGRPPKASNEPESNRNSREDSKPRETWIKVHRRHILPETLIEYSLPWQVDEYDTNYLLIKKWIPEDLQEELFAHTRELRHQWGGRQKWRSGDQQRPRNQESEGQKYRAPQCERTKKPLSFEILIKGAPGTQDKLTESSPLFRASIPGVRTVELSSSRISGYGKIDMYRKHGLQDSDPTQMTWMHMERETTDFEDFTTFAIQAPGLYKQDVAIILRLLAKVRRTLRITKDEPPGGFHDDCTLRCVSRETGNVEAQKSATFMSFPYFSVESIKKDSQRRLLQTYYRQTTTQREREQAILMTGRFPSDHITFVPQLWAIVLDSRLLITCASIPFSHISAKSLHIADSPASRSSSGPSIIRLTDHIQRVFFIPMAHCQTWFALMDKVKNGCLSDIEPTNLEFQLFTITGHPVHAETWHEVSRGHKSTILPLSVRFVNEKAPKAARRVILDIAKWQSRIEGPFDEDSPEQSVESVGPMALIKRRPTWAREERENKDTAETAQSQTADQHRSSHREVGHLLPANSGIINNATDIPPAKAEEEIYFLPDNVSANGSFRTTREKENASPSIGYSIRSTGISPSQPEGAGATLSPTPSINADPELGAENKAPPDAAPVSGAEIKLNVPPVFTWSIGERSKPDRESDPSDDIANLAHWNYSQNNIITSEEESLSYVCGYLHTQLVETTTEEGDLYMGTSSKSFNDIEKLLRDTFSASATMLEKENPTEHSTSDSAMAPWKLSLKRATSILLRLLNLFMPAAYQCEVGEKYMGALSDFLTGLCDLRHSSQHNRPARHGTNNREIVEIVDISGPTETDLRGLDDLDLLKVPIADCVRCKKRETYSTREDAVDHLMQVHFRAEAVLKTTTSWVMDKHQKLELEARRAGEAVIRALVDNCKYLEEMMSEIRYGVSGNGEFDRDTYRISKSLVRAFQHLLLMIVYAARGTQNALEKLQGHTSDDSPILLDRVSLLRQLQSGAQAERSLRNAKREILLMTFTDDSSAIGTYQAGSPELVLATIMGDLRSRDSNNGKVDLVEIYRVYMLGLETRVIQYPGHRLLSDIRLAMQELEIIRKFTMKQRLLCVNYRALLAPQSFRITTASRQASFNFEKNKLNRLIRHLNDDAGSIDRLLEKADSLAKETQNGVEVRQEDHGKAILAFTIVTVIFLPLSFVTSFLGMNTTDIRDTNYTQILFWAVSLPLTALVIAVSLVIGFRGNELQEFIHAQQWWGLGNWLMMGSMRNAHVRLIDSNYGKSRTLPSGYYYTETSLGGKMYWGEVVAVFKRLKSRWNVRTLLKWPQRSRGMGDAESMGREDVP
ncbi:hypothetical protein PENCOP_c002G01146 [Penicillium coprophilum]|uniref:Uncharacterized protein n=1 Tax=Penicillium coprophilum TaxID=36646 RepID=A0A1V6V170_9EURO|nr:hypothetical protein PENCOP_c002G01146 [Penicillium coprophilum]